jgi:PIN domain nuclease of toxin-antitoxin system
MDEADRVVVSAASIWEIEIKRALGRLRAPDDLADRCDESGFERLDITFDHAEVAGRLPFHHSDPFDRVLVAQARMEGMTLATADSALAAYDVPIFEVGRR